MFDVATQGREEGTGDRHHMPIPAFAVRYEDPLIAEIDIGQGQFQDLAPTQTIKDHQSDNSPVTVGAQRSRQCIHILRAQYGPSTTASAISYFVDGNTYSVRLWMGVPIHSLRDLSRLRREEEERRRDEVKKAITTMALTSTLLLPASGMAAAQASTPAPTTVTVASVTGDTSGVSAASTARKRCKGRKTRRFNRAMAYFSFTLGCITVYKKKHWKDPTRAKIIIRARKIILPCYRSGFIRGNRRGTIVRITQWEPGHYVRWRGRGERWTAHTNWSWEYMGWRVHDLRGSKSGRIYESVCTRGVERRLV